MTELNPFSPEVLAKESGLPMEAPSGNENPFSGTLSSTFIASQDEVDTISAVQNKSVESPRNFGFVQIPATIANEFNRSMTSIPSTIGGTLLEAGELSQSTYGKPISEVAATSLESRVGNAVRANLQAPWYAKTPAWLQGMGILWGVTKDAALSYVSDGTVPQALVDAGNAMMQQNEAANELLWGKRQTGLAADVGAGLGSVAQAIGAWYIGKTPSASGAYYAWVTNSNDYIECVRSGKDAESCAIIAGASALGQGKIESIGMGVFTGVAAFSQPLKRLMFRLAEQPLEEAAQGVVEETVKGVSGVRDTTFEEKMHNVLYQGMLGLIVGAPVSTVFHIMETSATKEGLDPSKVKSNIEAFLKNKDKVIDGAVDLINKELSGVTRTDDDVAAAKEARKKVLADDAATEQAAATDPQAAAKVILKTANEDVAASIRALPEGFTMEQLQQAVQSPSVAEDIALAESLALSEKQRTEWEALKENLSGSKKAVVSARALTKEQAIETQNRIIEIINNSGLDAADKAKFVTTIRDTQTADQLVRNIDDITARVDSLIDQSKRKQSVAKIKSMAAKAKKSQTIAFDLAKKAVSMADRIDFTERQPATIASLRKTAEYFKNNPTATMPDNVRKQLQILEKKPISEVSTKELEKIAADMEETIKQGKVKLKLMRERAAKKKEKRLVAIEKQAATMERAIEEAPTTRANIGEQLARMERIKNSFRSAMNAATKVNIAISPMDVFFDWIDGIKGYKGAIYKTFKESVDVAHNEYLDLKRQMTEEIKTLHDDLKLNAKNHEKIGVWAILQQQGGRDKLLASGITEKELANLKLTPNEMKMYNLMRAKLDEVFPYIQDVMKRVYNKDVGFVENYFPFVTDYSNEVNLEIHDMVDEAFSPVANKVNVELGFTKSRVKSKKAVRMDALDVFMRHMDSASYLAKMGEEVKSLGAVAKDSRYKDAVGDLAQQMTVEWVDLLARKGLVQNRIQWIDAMKRNVGSAILGLKLSSVFVQPSALADGSSLIGGTYTSRGAALFTQREWRQFVWDNMPELRERVGDDPAYLDLGGDGIVRKAREAGFYMLKKVDHATASSVAIGAYLKAVEDSGGVVDLSKPDKAAIVEAQRIVRRTQSSALAKDLAPALSRGGFTGNASIDGLIFQFQSFMLNRWSVIQHDLYRAGIKGGKTKEALNIFTWMMMATAFEIGSRELAAEALAAVFGDDDKKDKELETKVALTLAGNIPFISQGVSMFGYGSVPVPSIDFLSDIAQEGAWAMASKSEAKRNEHLVKLGISIAGVTAGVPGVAQTKDIMGRE